jgi:hypothetical protein
VLEKKRLQWLARVNIAMLNSAIKTNGYVNIMSDHQIDGPKFISRVEVC